ncbi:MAG: serine/threonine-protein kinase [Kofleriaceae bacterium]
MEPSEFGSYEILGQLGQGAMGVVYLGRHSLLDRHAAIKVLHADHSQNTEVVTRFFNEARAATRIRHPGIVEIYDFGHAPDGSAFLVMELLSGETLTARIARAGRLDALEAVRIARQVASALEAAHTSGIVHRDLKPDNLLIVPDPDVIGGERVKVLDFGIAKLSSSDSTLRTVAGRLMGTPNYISPEQALDSALVDVRTDIYALGCILYQMVCGRVPFKASGLGELVALHISAAPFPPSQLVPELPPALEAMILKCLEKDPGDRYPTMAALLAELDQLDPGRVSQRSIPTEAVLDRAATPWPPSLENSGTPASAPRVVDVMPRATTARPTARTTRHHFATLAMFAVAAVLGVAIGLVALDQSSTPQDDLFTGTTAPAATSGPAPARPVLPHPAAPIAPNQGPAPRATAARTTAPASARAAPPTSAPMPLLFERRPPPSRVTLMIASTPSGARVFRATDGALLGKTPLRHAVDRADGELMVVVKRAGYRDKRVSVSTARDTEVNTRLVRARRRE